MIMILLIKSKLCYMNVNTFIVYIKSVDIYVDIAKDFKTRFDTSNYELERPILEGEK